MRSSHDGGDGPDSTTRKEGKRAAKLDDGVLGLSKTMTAYPGSSILPPSESLRKMMQLTEKNLIIHIVLNWIHQARQSTKLDILPPQLAHERGQEEGKERDMHEEHRARTLEELELLWCENITDTQWGRLRVIERILEVDWPQGLTYAMTASFVFESIRATPLSRQWTAVHLDYGDDEETLTLMGKKGKGAARHRMYETITPQQLKDRFSSELKQFCSHSILIDEPVKRLPIRSQMYAAIAPLPFDWTQPFTHLRIVNGQTSFDICSKGLHILHIPQSPWFLISGRLGGFMADVREMALNALAHSLGARRMRHPDRSDSNALSHGKMGELKGYDALALRAIILSENNVQDRDSTAGRINGGKGKAMRCGDAEDGPLIQADKRRRDDTTGLYEDVSLREQGEQYDAPSEGSQLPLCHPAERRWLRKSKVSQQRKRKREAQEMFGRDEHQKETKDANGKDGLPRLEHIEYELRLPFPTLPEYGTISQSSLMRNVVHLRLDGVHVLSGLKKLVNAGLDVISDAALESRRGSFDSQPAMSMLQAGLPTWLTEARGTKVMVGTDIALDHDTSEEEVRDA